jgi:hypothetical protein
MASGESAVVLLSQADWPRWLAVIQTMTNYNSVWDYIKPTLQTGEVRRELREPSPLVATFSATPNVTIQSRFGQTQGLAKAPQSSKTRVFRSFRVCNLQLQVLSFNHRTQ